MNLVYFSVSNRVSPPSEVSFLSAKRRQLSRSVVAFTINAVFTIAALIQQHASRAVIAASLPFRLQLLIPRLDFCARQRKAALQRWQACFWKKTKELFYSSSVRSVCWYLCFSSWIALHVVVQRVPLRERLEYFSRRREQADKRITQPVLSQVATILSNSFPLNCRCYKLLSWKRVT